MIIVKLVSKLTGKSGGRRHFSDHLFNIVSLKKRGNLPVHVVRGTDLSLI